MMSDVNNGKTPQKNILHMTSALLNVLIFSIQHCKNPTVRNGMAHKTPIRLGRESQ